MKVIFTLTSVALMLFCQNLFGQTSISGVVTAENGDSLPGVTIVVQNTTNGTTTDMDGNYSISAQPGDILVFSSIGFKSSEVLLNGQTIINMVLKENVQGLDEVVVIAYGETERRKFTGALATVGAAEIDQIPQTSPLQMVQGRAAGVLVEDNSGAPGATGTILVRGAGSYSSNTDNTEPLYVVDGIPTSNFQAFNPNDIESISILKDASATSIYGSRAANGVVIVTTKKGKAGKTQIGFNAQVGFSDLENPNDFGVMNATQYKEYYREAYANAGMDPDALMPTDADSINTDWIDNVLRTGVTQLYEVNLSGGNEKVRHYVSGSYFSQEGIVVGTKYERYTGRLNLSMTPAERIGVDINVLGSFANNDLQFSDAGRSGTFSGAFNVAPTASIYATESTPAGLNGLGYNFDLPSNAGHNPVASASMNSRTEQIYRAFPTLKLTIEPIDNLSISSSGSVDLAVAKSNAFQSKYYYAETDNGLSEALTSYSIKTNFNAMAKYDWDINNDHKITPMVGVEAYKTSFESEGAESRDFGYDGIPLTGEGTLMLDILSDYYASTLFSVFSKINYSFKNKLFLDVSFRTDGSSRFGPDNRYGQFYGVGVGYDLTEESFLSGQETLSLLRVRGSYGIQGNYNIGDYQWRKTYNSNGAFIVPGGSNAGAQAESPGNEAIKWEESVSANLGIDFGLLQNRITGTVELYSRGSDALLGERQISLTSGFASYVDNLGDINNKGVEISLNTVNLQTDDFTWTSNFNITFNKNEIKKLNADADTVATSNIQANIKGETLGQWFMPIYAGVDPGNGQPVYRDEEGGLTYNTADAVIASAGKSAINPDFYGGFTNTLTYKGFSLSAMFYFKYGFKIYNDLRQQLSVPGGNNVATSNLDRWQQPGDKTTVPKVDFNDQTSSQFQSTRWLEDGSYIRLRNVTVAYTLPTTLTSKWNMSDLTLSLRGVNLLTFTEYSGYDPGVGSIDEDSNYPINRTITFGLSAKF